MDKKKLEKTFYLIAKYWLGELEGFVKIGNDRDEIIKLFQEKYVWKPGVLGVTEESYQLLEVNAKEIMNDTQLIRGGIDD